MEDLTQVILDVLIPAVVFAVLGMAIPVLNEKRAQLKASKNELLILIIERTIRAGVAFFKEQNREPTIDGVTAYVKGSIPDTIAAAKADDAALQRKVIATAGKELAGAAIDRYANKL